MLQMILPIVTVIKLGKYILITIDNWRLRNGVTVFKFYAYTTETIQNMCYKINLYNYKIFYYIRLG